MRSFVSPPQGVESYCGHDVLSHKKTKMRFALLTSTFYPTLGGADPGLELDAYLDEPQLHRAFVAEVAGRVIGFCGLLLRGEESELEGLTFDY